MSQEESPNNSHLLFVGQQCHAPQCYMVDFLPFTCEHCKVAFCADHYRPADHSCDKFDAAKHDRVAPQCPLCNKPVAIPLNEDPNLRMEQHIESECGRAARPGAMPLCAKGRCGKRLFAPIKCNGCGEQFCAAHRFASAHECSGAGAVKAAAAQSAGPSLASRTSAASAAAMAAIRRNAATISAPKPKPASASSKPASTSSKPASTSSKAASTSSKPASIPSKTPSTSSGRASTSTSGGTAKAESSKHTNPFSKTDRRARAEQESRLKGLRERAKKGLLSEREQVLLAEAEAELSEKKDSECVVM